MMLWRIRFPYRRALVKISRSRFQTLLVPPCLEFVPVMRERSARDFASASAGGFLIHMKMAGDAIGCRRAELQTPKASLSSAGFRRRSAYLRWLSYANCDARTRT